MNTLDIFCFTSVARTSSFSITARELLISQQAVSRHIKSMEDELGFPLFLRNYQSVRLTAAGELMLAYFLERDRLLASWSGRTESNGRPPCLRVGLSQWVGCIPLFQGLLDRFTAARPGVRVCIHDLTAAETRQMLLHEELDLLLTTRYAASFLPVDWRVLPLCEMPLCLQGSGRRKYDFSRAGDYPIFVPLAGEADECTARARFQSMFAALGFRAERVEPLPDMGSVSLSVLLRGGLAPSPRGDLLAGREEYVVHPLGRSVTVVLCMPYQPAYPGFFTPEGETAPGGEAPGGPVTGREAGQ